MRIVVIGRSEILFNATRRLVESGYSIPLIVTAKEAPEYTKTSRDFESLAYEIDADFLVTPKLTPEIIEGLFNKHQPFDLGVSVNYTGIIPQSVIDLFRIGILNLHGGDLPRYRGNACQAWAILNAEQRVGLCVHKMIGGELDSGDIVERAYLDLNMSTCIGEVYEWMKVIGPSLLLSAVNRLDHNPNYVLEVQSKNPYDALRCYPRKPEDGQISWSDDAASIVRLINASSEPYQGAFSFYKDKKIIIWRAKLYADVEQYLAIPGQILNIHENGNVIIATGHGKIALMDVQIDQQRDKPRSFFKSLRDRLK